MFSSFQSFHVFKVFKLSSFQSCQVFKLFRFPAPVWLSDIFSWEPALWTLMSGDRVWWMLMMSKKKHWHFQLYFSLGTSSMNSKLTGEGDEDDYVKKSIAIFSNKQWVLSIEMKTKIVQHVPTINISIWHMTCAQSHVTCDMRHVT